MKICYISTLWDEKGTGGRESYAKQLAYCLKENNEIVVINTHRRLKSSIIYKDRIKFYKIFHFNILFYEDYYLRSSKLNFFIKALWHFIDTFNFFTAFKVLKIIKNEKFDIIHIHGIKGFSTIICLFSRLFNKKVIFSLHSYEFLCIAGVFLCPLTQWGICKRETSICKLYRFLKKIMVSYVPVVIAPSKFILEKYKEYGFFKNSRYKIVPNFIEGVLPVLPSKLDNKDSFLLLYVGRLCKDKGVDILIESFKLIKANSTYLHIIGTGPDNDLLKESAENDERIIFHGYLNYEELKQFYRKADVVVVPSIWYEVFGIVIIEAFSFGVPAIGSRIGGIPEVIQDGFNGFLFSPGNKEELKDKMEIFISDFQKEKRLLNIFRNNAYETSKKYSIEHILPQIVEIYRNNIDS